MYCYLDKWSCFLSLFNPGECKGQCKIASFLIEPILCIQWVHKSASIISVFGHANEGALLFLSLYKVPFQSMFGTGQDPCDFAACFILCGQERTSFIPG